MDHNNHLAANIIQTCTKLHTQTLLYIGKIHKFGIGFIGIFRIAIAHTINKTFFRLSENNRKYSRIRGCAYDGCGTK